MAQEKARRGRALARRFGLAGQVAVAIALVAVVAGVVALRALGTGDVTVERASGGAAEEAVEGTDSGVEKGGAEKDEGAPTASEVLLVHVDGAVMMPGVYELEAGARVIDAVEAAGGLAEGADTSSVNLAAAVADGQKVRVPLVGEELAPEEAGALASPPEGEALVNINTAGIEELDELPGVGEATARAIVEDRNANGPFSVPEDLMRVSGIGEKKFARLQGLICV